MLTTGGEIKDNMSNVDGSGGRNDKVSNVDGK